MNREDRDGLSRDADISAQHRVRRRGSAYDEAAMAPYRRPVQTDAERAGTNFRRPGQPEEEKIDFRKQDLQEAEEEKIDFRNARPYKRKSMLTLS